MYLPYPLSSYYTTIEVMKRNHGFTIIELLTVLTLTVIVTSLLITQKSSVDASLRDKDRKAALNSIYYGLKEGYYPTHQSYPSTINKKILPYTNPDTFSTVGDDIFAIHYIGKNCSDGKCQGFELKVKLEKEATYSKTAP
jgi:prepilin-type N-terminal cleavage/methylation domain-containing protein